MKIRCDYVSNSSSSSFIVKLDKSIHDYSLDEFKRLFASNTILEEIYARLKDEIPKSDASRSIVITFDPDELGCCAERNERYFDLETYHNVNRVRRA